MTAVMVMRPEFTQTYSRSVARFGGTVVGVGCATGIVQLAHPTAWPSAALAVISAGLMYLLMRTGYAVSQVCVSAYVVFLLGMAGDDWAQTVPERVLLTFVGGLLAMVAYALYPAWETPRLRDRLVSWLVTDGRYAATVLDRYADPASRSLDDVRAALLTTREARVAWQEALETARHEPVRHRGISRTAASDAEDALAQFGRVAMLMEAHLPAVSANPVPEAAGLAVALRRATEQAAKAVRERRVPDWEPVRAELRRRDAEGPVPDTFVRDGALLLLDALEDFSQALEGTRRP